MKIVVEAVWKKTGMSTCLTLVSQHIKTPFLQNVFSHHLTPWTLFTDFFSRHADSCLTCFFLSCYVADKPHSQ